MKLTQRICYLLLNLFCLFPLSAATTYWTPEDLPMVHLQDSTRFVCNPDGILRPETVQATDLILGRLKLKKGVESVVVVVKRIKGDDPYEFGMALGRKYGVGSKEQQSGLIIVCCTEDRSFQILTGRGLEGTLPDAICRRMQNLVFFPAFKEGNWDKGIYEGVKAIEGYVMGDPTLKRKFEKRRNKNDSMGGFAIFVVGIVAFLIFFRIGNKTHRRCPICKKPDALVIKDTRRVRIGQQWVTRTTWVCRHCGHTEHEDSDDSPFNGGGMFIPPIIGGGHRGGWGGGFGGGFGGGSFGGGSFGGGGSGGRF